MVGINIGTDKQERVDRYTLVYAFGFLVIYFLTSIAYVPFLYVAGGAVLFLAYALYALLQIAAAIARLQRRRTLSIAVPLIAIVMLYWAPHPAVPRDKLWIAATLPLRWLQVQIATPSRFVAFSADCRPQGILTIPDCLSIVYDESGEIGLPNEERSQEWRKRNERDLNNGSVCGECRTSHVIGHFWVQ